ncbi:hypothetical protein H5J24_00260 [Chryseobacterium capnotolerans]|uniref:hypothetical protein n=1 Tax=Chryseobacterium TaxID=59732 RepID=UPI00083AC3EF|nr:MULTISPECIES: hypothetical protein [Chryseobacterium]UHO38677.1 hypothetical protein H5J24_00260 [Chryseobacterium capnotolerans]
MKKLFNGLIILTLLLCSFQKESETELSANATVATENDRIIYLFFKADKDQSGIDKIVLQNSRISNGRLKYSVSFKRNEAQKGDYIITLAESGGREIAQQLIKNPLNPTLEVYEKEGITRQKASLQNVEFSARFSYSENIQLVKIEKVTESGVQLLFTQKLSL